MLMLRLKHKWVWVQLTELQAPLVMVVELMLTTVGLTVY